MNNADQIDTGQLSAQAIADALQVVQDVFRHVAPLIRERAGKVTEYTEKQRDGSPVTATDMAVEQQVMAELTQRLPGVPIFGEESGYSDDQSGTFWLIDPIDGTKSFMSGEPSYTTMAVLIQANEAAACVIYNPSSDSMYVAQKGRGAFKNGVRLDLAQVPLPRQGYCKGRVGEALSKMLEAKGVVCGNGPNGAGFGFSQVAEGLAAARFNMFSKGYIHDYATGALLVKEAGGALVAIDGDEYTYKMRNFVACHPELEAIVREHITEIRRLQTELQDE